MKRNNDLRGALPKDIYDRFELWGRVMRPTSKQELSPTAQICARLEREAGIVQQGVAAGIGLTDAQRKEGEAVELAWSHARHPVRWKIAIAKYFVFNLPVEVIARQMKMPIGQTRDAMIYAVTVTNRIRMNIEECGVPEDNRFHNLLTG